MFRFRSRQSNLIVATNVIDEGVDIPACTLVIKYDELKDFRGYIQSKGRARHRTSHYIILVPKHDEKYFQKYKDFLEKQEILKNVINQFS